MGRTAIDVQHAGKRFVVGTANGQRASVVEDQITVQVAGGAQGPFAGTAFGDGQWVARRLIWRVRENAVQGAIASALQIEEAAAELPKTGGRKTGLHRQRTSVGL